MAILAIQDGTIIYGEHDLSGISNEMSADVERNPLDATVFTSDGWEELLPGLMSSAWSVSGLLDIGAVTGEPDLSLFDEYSGNALIMSLTNPAAEGDVAFFTNPIKGSYQMSIPVGDIVRYSAEYMGDRTVKGIIAANEVATSNSNTTGVQHGDVISGQSAYAAIAVLGGTFTTLDVTIGSDDNSGFTTEVTRFTFTQATGATAEVLTPLAGPVTDDWWRVNWTFSGTDATFVVFFGIQ
jgi:hypothetical protein